MVTGTPLEEVEAKGHFLLVALPWDTETTGCSSWLLAVCPLHLRHRCPESWRETEIIRSMSECAQHIVLSQGWELEPGLPLSEKWMRFHLRMISELTGRFSWAT